MVINLCNNSYAQSTNCGVRQYAGGGWNRPISQVKSPSASLGGYTLPSTNLIGDNYDELFSVEPPFNSNPSKWYMKTADGSPTGVATLFTGANNYIGSWGIGFVLLKEGIKSYLFYQ